MRKIIVVVLLFFNTTALLAQTVDFKSSNLPIVVINTSGESIIDEPKITAEMGIIYNGDGVRNFTTDLYNEYDGFIGIEIRGKSSQNWPKKSYAVETRDADGKNNNVSIFGMPKENDWVLYAPFVDKTLLRNVFMYKLATELGWYAPRTMFCELVINGEYMGVYVFTEKIKRDKGRVDISKASVENVTGGYILEMIMNNKLEDDETHFKLQQSGKEIVVKYPKSDDVSTDQLAYISNYFNELERVLNSESFSDSLNGYSKYINMSSFIDHMLLSECFNQLDAFSHSVYFYKDKDEKLHLGPGWDYNRSMGNAKYYTSWRTDVWWLREPYGSNPELWFRINWPKSFMADNTFMNAYSKRWNELRQTTFSFKHLYSTIDSCVVLLDEAKERNFERWEVLGVDYNNKYIFETYVEEVNYMKDWISEKFIWLDEQFNLPENYALNNLYSYSSQETGDLNPASNAVDAAVSTRWSAQFFPQWIEIDMKEVKSINKLVVVPYKSRSYQYVIESKSKYDDLYSPIVNRLNNTEGGNEIIDIIDPVNARFLKLTVTGADNYTGDWVSILEFKAFGSLITSSEFANSEINSELTLSQNHPNPFKITTEINFSIPKSSFVTLKVIDIRGQVVAELINDIKHKGRYNVSFNASGLTPGLYFYKIQTENYSATKKMLLVN